MNEQQQPQITLDMLDKATDIQCEECENSTFEERLQFKKVSKFLLGAAEDVIVPLKVIACAKCGHINDEFKYDFKKGK